MLRLRNTVIILLGINFTEMYFLAYSNYMCHKSIIFKVFFISLLLYECLRASLVGKESTCIAGALGSIPASGRSPGEGKWPPTLVFLPGKSHGHRSLVCYSLWCRGLDMIE